MINYTAQQKILLSKRARNLLMFWSGIMFKIRYCLQIFPWLCVGISKNAVFRGHIFFTLAKKILFIKNISKFWHFQEWKMSLTLCCLQIFLRPDNFTIILCWNFENSKFLLFMYTFGYIYIYTHIFLTELLFSK